MKKFYCVAFILFVAIGVFAQDEKTIGKSEFDRVYVNSMRKFVGQSYRQIENSQDILNSTGENKVISKSIMEFTLRQGSRSVYESESSIGKKRTETIFIGDKIYTRIDNGEWTVKTREARPEFENKLKLLEEQIEYKSLGTEKLNDQNARVYARIRSQKLINESNKSEMSMTITTKYWFGEDGSRLKEEMQVERRVKSEKIPSGLVSNSSRVTVWELDPTIKIEAPIAEK